MKVGIIGGGAMGEAMVSAMLRCKLVGAGEITVAERLPERRQALESAHGVVVEAEADKTLGADHVVLAVKPQEFAKLAAGIAGRLRPQSTAVSIMAGVTMRAVREGLKHEAVVRSIPNTPAQVGEGMTVWTASQAVGAQAKEEVRQVFGSLGREAYVPDERYIDMATAVSGSGPGFVLLLVEAMIDAAVHIGLGRDLATEMVLQTFAGSARLAQETGRHPADLRNMVTSPAGTTAEGLGALEARGTRAAMLEAVIAAYNRSKVLGDGTAQK